MLSHFFQKHPVANGNKHPSVASGKKPVAKKPRTAAGVKGVDRRKKKEELHSPGAEYRPLSRWFNSIPKDSSADPQ